jgi:hypothetical protein
MKTRKPVIVHETVETVVLSQNWAIIEPAGGLGKIPERVIATFTDEGLATLFVETINARYSPDHFTVRQIVK